MRELPAWQALGPHGEAVLALIERCKTVTPDEARKMDAARDAAWDAAWDVAMVASDVARDAAWHAARGAARDAASALVVRDLITPEQFHLLAGPWESVMGAIGEGRGWPGKNLLSGSASTSPAPTAPALSSL